MMTVRISRMASLLVSLVIGIGCDSAPRHSAAAKPVELPDLSECETEPPPWNDACTSLNDACKESECDHDVWLCKAGKLLDFAHSFAEPPPFALRKLALEQAQDRLEQALLGEVPEYDPQGSIIFQLSGVGGAFRNSECTAVPDGTSGPADRIRIYHSKLANAVSSLTSTTQELIEMDLAEADQAVGLYQGYEEGRTKEWKDGVDLIALGSRNSALNRLTGVPETFFQATPGGSGIVEIPTQLAILEPCTVDATRPDVARAIVLRKRFDCGLGMPGASEPGCDLAHLVEVVNAVLAQENAKEVDPITGEVVLKQYTTAGKILSDYGTNAAAFADAGLYLNQEAQVFFRDPVVLDAGTAKQRWSVLPPLSSYGTLQQRRVKTRATPLYDQANMGLYYRLGYIRSLLDGLSQTSDLLQMTRKEIASLVGSVEVVWEARFDFTHQVCPNKPVGTRYLAVFVRNVNPPELVTPYLRVFYGEDNAACATFNRYAGQTCDPQVAPGDTWGGGGRFTRLNDSTAVYGMCDPPDFPFLFWQFGPTKYVAYDAADLTSVVVEEGVPHPLVQRSPIGGSLAELGLRISDRSKKNCGESRYNSLGLIRDLVPPLENELTDTGKPFEDSFAYYLNLADQAARDAFALAESARKVEGEIKQGERALADTLNNLHADSNDQIGQICGADADPAVGCHANIVEVPFSSLKMLPNITYCNTAAPLEPASAGLEETGAFVEEMRAFTQAQSNCVIKNLNESTLKVPAEFYGDGTLTEQERSLYGGEYLATLLEVDKDLHTVARIAIGMQGSMATFDTHLEEMYYRLDQLDDAGRQFFISMMGSMGKFLSASANSWTSFGASEVGAALTFLAESLQNELNFEHGLAAQAEALAKFRGDAITFVSAIKQQAEEVRYAFSNIAAVGTKLSNLELKQQQLQAAADRHAETAKLVSPQYNPYTQATFHREGERARQALRRSKMFSFIARRAIEFKLVKNLQKEVGTEPYVEAPKRWVDSVFAASHPGDSEETDTWAESTIGYVQNLRDYVTAYPFIYPFQDGNDWAVISLRDDYFRPSFDCFVPAGTKNLLESSEVIACESENGLWLCKDDEVSLTWTSSNPPPGTTGSTLVETLGPKGGAFGAMVPARAGSTLTVSAWMRSDMDVTPVWYVPQPSSDDVVAAAAFVVDGTWRKYTWTFEVETTMLSAGELGIAMGLLTPGQFYVYGPQVEVGSQATDYQPTPPPAPKNRLPWSEDFSQWARTNEVGTVVTTVAPLPAGAAKATLMGVNDPTGGALFVTASAQVGETLTLSAWLRSDASTRPAFAIRGQVPEGAVEFREYEPTSGWTRRSWSFLVEDRHLDQPGGSTITVGIGMFSMGVLLLHGAQLEAAAEATDYQRTPLLAVDTTKCAATAYDGYGNPVAATPLTSVRAASFRDHFSVKCVNDSAVSDPNTDCSQRGGVEYYQLPFSFSIADMEAGKVIKDFQIAAGNYNYRVQDIGLNFVGSNVKDCSLDDINREACYANMFLPYSLFQDGQVKLRDHNQQILEFGMPAGRIENAKGIAAERYLTIPLSSTDQSAISPYLKREFRGRPLEGSFILQVRNVPSLAWDNLEDVQLLIHYRYWTAFGQ